MRNYKRNEAKHTPPSRFTNDAMKKPLKAAKVAAAKKIPKRKIK